MAIRMQILISLKKLSESTKNKIFNRYFWPGFIEPGFLFQIFLSCFSDKNKCLFLSFIE
jgi:hypothetical protein